MARVVVQIHLLVLAALLQPTAAALTPEDAASSVALVPTYDQEGNVIVHTLFCEGPSLPVAVLAGHHYVLVTNEGQRPFHDTYLQLAHANASLLADYVDATGVYAGADETPESAAAWDVDEILRIYLNGSIIDHADHNASVVNRTEYSADPFGWTDTPFGYPSADYADSYPIASQAVLWTATEDDAATGVVLACPGAPYLNGIGEGAGSVEATWMTTQDGQPVGVDGLETDASNGYASTGNISSLPGYAGNFSFGGDGIGAGVWPHLFSSDSWTYAYSSDSRGYLFDVGTAPPEDSTNETVNMTIVDAGFPAAPCPLPIDASSTLTSIVPVLSPVLWALLAFFACVAVVAVILAIGSRFRSVTR